MIRNRSQEPAGRISRRRSLWAPVAIAVCAVAVVAAVGVSVKPGVAPGDQPRTQQSSAAMRGAWRPAAGPRALVHALVRAPWGTLYAGTTQGVESSDDGGAAWHAVGRGFPGSNLGAWGVATITGPHGAAVLATCGDGAVYRLARTRTGTRWVRSGAPIGSAGAYAIYTLPGDVVLAGSDRGIYRSGDGGRSWARVAAITGGAVAAFARNPASGAIYAGLAGLQPTLRVSVDGGRAWRVPAGIAPPPSVEALIAAPGHVYAGVMGAPQAVWTAHGRGFTPLVSGLPRAVHGMALAATGGEPGRLFVGTMGDGVYVTSAVASGRWTPLGRGHGPGDGVVTSLLVLSGARPTVLAGTGTGIYRLGL